MGGTFSTHGEMRNLYISVENPERRVSSVDEVVDGKII
jgi:hypothetical protein